MNYNYTLNEISKIITVRTTGHLKTKELSEMGVLMRTKARNLKCKILFDYSLSKNFISITEAFYWFSDYYDVADMKLRDIPAAIISNIEDLDFFYFLETTCFNQGIKIKVFLDEKTAEAWLAEF